MSHLAALAIAALAALPAASAPSTGRVPTVQDEAGGQGGEAGPETLASRDERQKAFREAYSQAYRLKAFDEMTRLLKKQVNEAVYEIMDICIAIEREERPELTEQIYAFEEGWRKAYPESNFVMGVYEYYSLQASHQKRERQRLQKFYDRANNELLDTLASGEEEKLGQLAAEFEGYADSFAQIGDRYHASMAWNNVAICYDDRYREEGADLDRAYEAYGEVIRFRELLELKDDYHAFAVARRREIVEEGYGPGAGSLGGDDGAGEAAGGAAAGTGEAKEPAEPAGAAPVVGPMEFEAVDDLDRFERPSYDLDGYYEIWPVLYFTGRGTQATIHYMDESPPFQRTGDSAIAVDSDRDGEFETKVPIKGGEVLTEMEIEIGGVKRPWAIVSRIGTDQDFYQGVQVNMQPQLESFSLSYVPAASMVMDVGGTPVRIFDDNLDGLYGSEPRSWQYLGLAEGSAQPELDSVIIGTGKRAVPWSKYQQLDGTWYEWESLDAGTRLNLKPARFKTGSLKLSVKGSKPDWLIVCGTDRVAGAYFDLADGKEVEVPVGTYELYYGELRKGKRRQQVKAVILGSKATKYNVKADETTTVTIGAPYAFQFDWNLTGSVLEVPGRSVVVVGNGGERYERIWNAVPRPEVSWRKAGTKRGSKPEDMQVVLDQDVLFQPGGWQKSWHPLDLALDIGNVPDEGIEVQLVEKKNKLFGKIESAWRD